MREHWRDMSGPASGERGFSLVELMIAMVVTMIISGAIVGLLSGGGNAFQKDPQRTDRQQNIRIALDLIQRDIQSAGMNMGAFGQAFRDQLNGFSSMSSVINAGQRADALAIWGDDGSCPEMYPKPGTCGGVGNPVPCSIDGVNVVGASPVASCYRDDEFLLLIYPNGRAKWGFAHNVHSQIRINFPAGQQPTFSQIKRSPQDLYDNGLGPAKIVRLMYIRYEIRPCATTDPLACLWRSDWGGIGVDGALHLPPAAAEVTAGNWQIIARGVEDLQVRYRNGNGAWQDNPGVVDQAGANYATIVREVEVTLSARTVADNVAGPGLPQRGRLAVTTSPRAALFALQSAPQGSGQDWR